MRNSDGRKGTATIEFALTAPFLLFLLAGVLNYGAALRAAIAVSDAARAGAQFGSGSVSVSADTAGMRSAAVNSAPYLAGLTATPVRTCECPRGSEVPCTAGCAGTMLTYVRVTATANVPPIFRYAGLGYTGDVSAVATMRVR